LRRANRLLATTLVGLTATLALAVPASAASQRLYAVYSSHAACIVMASSLVKWGDAETAYCRKSATTGRYELWYIPANT
jgi:hypothetical protein